MAVRDEAKKDWEQGMKRKEIAEKYGISENTVKSWISRHWKNAKGASKGVPKSNKKGAPKKGGQQGNQNAVGNDGGAPLGNSNAVKHGGYSAVYWDTLDDKEKDLIDTMPKDEETLLIDQIKMYSVRERRLLLAIEAVKKQKGNQILSGVSRTESKRSFSNEEDKKLYEERQAEKIANKEILPGEVYSLNTVTESKDSALARLESELTKVQNAKTKAISALAKLNIEKQRLDLLREKDDVEIEDTSDIDEVLYG